MKTPGKQSKNKRKITTSNRPAEHDVVVLLEKVKDDTGLTIPKGTTATIVHIYNRNNFVVECSHGTMAEVKAAQILVLRQEPKEPDGTVSATELLSAESTRLNVMAKAMKGRGREFTLGLAHMFNVSSAFLGSLNAPERIQRYQEVAPGGQ